MPEEYEGGRYFPATVASFLESEFIRTHPGATQVIALHADMIDEDFLQCQEPPNGHTQALGTNNSGFSFSCSGLTWIANPAKSRSPQITQPGTPSVTRFTALFMVHLLNQSISQLLGIILVQQDPDSESEWDSDDKQSNVSQSPKKHQYWRYLWPQWPCSLADTLSSSVYTPAQAFEAAGLRLKGVGCHPWMVILDLDKCYVEIEPLLHSSRQIFTLSQWEGVIRVPRDVGRPFLLFCSF
ncbi:hypothetical protein B0H10DRAFT_1955515 [Mycena sp. CBHHK59/15]|nr:hypothetical protein B0H10DRAFT_1955515 [Mycena sp. CBHHK59/15]